MRICHISSVHKRNDIRIFHKECQSLLKISSDIHLIVADGFGQDKSGLVQIHDAGKSKGRLSRFTKTVEDVLKIAISINADIYHLHDPELLRICKRLKKLNKIVIYDAHEDLPRQILSKPYISSIVKKPVSFTIEKYENKISRLVDGIITATPFIRDRFLKLNSNAIDINNYPMLSEIDFSQQEGQKQAKVCYIGGITKIRGIIELVKAMEFSNLSLALAGDITDNIESELVELVGWKNVDYLGFIDRQAASVLKAGSLAGIITFHPEPNHINAQPNKIFEYMASGLPIIGSDFPLWKEIIEKSNCGICVDPMSPKKIAKAINYFADNRDEARKMGQNGRKLVAEKYNWEFEEKKLLDYYKNIVR